MSRKISHCLNPTLYKVLKQTASTVSLNQVIGQYLPDELRDHVSVSSFNKGQLVLAVSNAGIANKLRFYKSELRGDLRSKAHFYQLANIEIKLTQAQQTKPLPTIKTKNNTAKTTPANTLEEALARLEQTIREKASLTE